MIRIKDVVTNKTFEFRTMEGYMAFSDDYPNPDFLVELLDN